jgi:hypothetical protein
LFGARALRQLREQRGQGQEFVAVGAGRVCNLEVQADHVESSQKELMSVNSSDILTAPSTFF